MKLNRKMAVVVTLGILILSANLIIAQPKLKYSNKKFQKETSSRSIDDENALLVGISKKKKEISVLDFYTGNILHSIDVTKHGLNEIEYYSTDESNTTGYYRGKNGKLISYNYKENKVNWVFNAHNVVDAPEIYSKTLQVKIKPEKKGGDNFVVINKATGNVVRTFKPESDDADSKWYTLYDDGEIAILEQKKGNISSGFIGEFIIQVRNSKTDAVIQSHTLNGASFYLKTLTDYDNSQLLIYFPYDLNATLKMSERGSRFQIVAIDTKNGDINWKMNTSVKVDFHISELISVNSTYIHHIMKADGKLIFGGRDFAEAINLETGKSLWTVPFSSTIHNGLLKPKLINLGFLSLEGKSKAMYVSEVSNPEKPTFSKIDLETGKAIWQLDLPKKTQIIPAMTYYNDNLLVTINGLFIEERSKSLLNKYIKPISLSLVDSKTGKAAWNSTIKDEVIVSHFLGDYPIAISEKAVQPLDSKTGKLLKKVEHKVDLGDYSQLFVLPDGKHLVVWGATFSVISTN